MKGIGDTTLAANAILLQFLSIMAFALDGFAFAAESLVGQAMGANDPAALNRAARMSLQWGYGGALLLAVTFGLGGYRAIQLMTTAPMFEPTRCTFCPGLSRLP